MLFYSGLRERAEAGAFLFEAMKSQKTKRGIAVKRERARPIPLPPNFKATFQGGFFNCFWTYLNVFVCPVLCI